MRRRGQGVLDRRPAQCVDRGIHHHEVRIDRNQLLGLVCLRDDPPCIEIFRRLDCPSRVERADVSEERIRRNAVVKLEGAWSPGSWRDRGVRSGGILEEIAHIITVSVLRVWSRWLVEMLLAPRGVSAWDD